MKEGNEWRPAVVLKKAVQPRSYIVKIESGEIVRRNRIQLMPSATEFVLDNKNVESGPTSSSNRALVDNESLHNNERAQLAREQIYVTRSGRQSRAPDRYGDYVMDF